MMPFTYSSRRARQSAAQRSVMMGTGGMVASSQSLATLAGYRILAKGGNAVDAAVAMVSTLSVVEPFSVGIGGDAFALIYLAKENRVVGMNASGRAPYRADIGWFQGKGISQIPERSLLAVTVPGALHGWEQALKRFGSMGLGDVFEDAIRYAEQGFPVTELIAGEWQNSESVLLATENGTKTYLIDGKAPRPGQRFFNRDLSRTYRTIVRDGTGAFYGGELCDAIVDFSDRNGGILSRKDFLDHQTTWVDPISTDYRGFTILELPPNGQGMVALEMLNVLEGYDIAGLGHNSPEYLHLLVEAKKAAFSNRDRYITDPEFEKIPVAEILSKDYAKTVRKRIDPNRADPAPVPSSFQGSSDTVYVTAVDKDRNAASFISSIFMHFGSGWVVDRTGILLQNRGKSFSLDPSHRNRIEPHKRPMHTIIPGMCFHEGKFLMSFGVMGADMQPQGHTQFLINLIDFKMNLQEAMDAPRARHLEGMEVYLEDGIPEATVSAMEGKGHRVLKGTQKVNQVGGGQAIYLDRKENVLLGASDRRKDGCAIGY